MHCTHYLSIPFPFIGFKDFTELMNSMRQAYQNCPYSGSNTLPLTQQGKFLITGMKRVHLHTPNKISRYSRIWTHFGSLTQKPLLRMGILDGKTRRMHLDTHQE